MFLLLLLQPFSTSPNSIMGFVDLLYCGGCFLPHTSLLRFGTVKMLKVPEHQVAGHMAKNDVLGLLVDDSGKFYTPLQEHDRGSAELSFYTSLAVPPSIRPFFLAFHGTVVVPASDGSGPHTHLLLQDLIAPYTKPSVMDVKIGSRTCH
ncbi:inositol polyphosphate multikinase beta-like [Vigna angularis]|uniref:inositol polyphosphate multikinase beta-like n=1 Tax=Phaseolus angularis TaxID=3914 RepID=UPI0022B37763|nr:inositol polyphosphate multikinase beta-like [Vigna angularis]